MHNAHQYSVPVQSKSDPLPPESSFRSWQSKGSQPKYSTLKLVRTAWSYLSKLLRKSDGFITNISPIIVVHKGVPCCFGTVARAIRSADLFCIWLDTRKGLEFPKALEILASWSELLWPWKKGSFRKIIEAAHGTQVPHVQRAIVLLYQPIVQVLCSNPPLHPHRISCLYGIYREIPIGPRSWQWSE